MQKKRLFSLLLLFSASVPLFAQKGGTSTYNFLRMPVSARTASLGGMAFSIHDSDIALISENPSLINQSINNSFVLSYTNFLSDINHGYAAYARTFKYVGTVAAAIQYINYGKFTETSIYDEKTGEFTAGEYALNLSFSKQLHQRIICGGTIKGIYSGLYENRSAGVAGDLAATYYSHANNFTGAFIIKNIGAQVKTYTPGIREPLPLEAHLGISKKIRFAPVRFLVTAAHLEKWNLMGPDSLYNVMPLSGSLFNGSSTGSSSGNADPFSKKYFFADNFARHFVFGAEVFPAGKIYLRFGHNIRQSRELRINGRSWIAGYTLGFGLRLKKFNFSYAFDAYHLAGLSNHFTLSVSPGQLVKRKKQEVLFEEIKPQ